MILRRNFGGGLRSWGRRGLLGVVVSHIWRDETAPDAGHPLVVSHPFRGKKRKGWGTGSLFGAPTSRVFFDSVLNRLLVGVLVMMMMVVVMVGMYDHHDLRLRRIG